MHWLSSQGVEECIQNGCVECIAKESFRRVRGATINREIQSCEGKDE